MKNKNYTKSLIGLLIAFSIIGCVNVGHAYDDYEYVPFGDYIYYFVDMNAGDNLSWSFNTYAEEFEVWCYIENADLSKDGSTSDSGIYTAPTTMEYLLVFVNLDIQLFRDGWIHVYFEVNYEPPPPPGPFTLTSNADNPDTDGSFSLQWTNSIDADNYSVYQDNAILASGLTSLSYLININSNDSYDFQITAFNIYGETDSNEITINVAIPPAPPAPTNGISSFNVLIVVGIISIVAVIIVAKRRRI